jgi:hypothetical protein
MYVVAIQRRSKWWRLETASTSQKLVQRLINEISLPGDGTDTSSFEDAKVVLIHHHAPRSVWRATGHLNARAAHA